MNPNDFNMPNPIEHETVKREISDFRLAFSVLREPYAWWVMLLGLVGTLLIFTGIACLAAWLIGGIDWLHQGKLAGTRWDEWILGGLGSIIVFVIGWFIFPLVLTAITGAFLEPLADRIERRYYPFAPAPRKVSVGEQIHSSIRVLSRDIGWNVLALPFYFIPVVNLVVYALLNSFLLSREYFQVVTLRHVPLTEAKSLYAANRKDMMRGGLSLSLLFLIPVVNLCAPLLATAWMVHRVWRRAESPLRVRLSNEADSGN